MSVGMFFLEAQMLSVCYHASEWDLHGQPDTNHWPALLHEAETKTSAQAATKTVFIHCYNNLSCSDSCNSNNQVSASRISLGPANIMYGVQTVLGVYFVVFLGYLET